MWLTQTRLSVPAPLPPKDAWREMDYAPVQPWFAQRLERAGVPVTRGVVKEEVRYKVSDTAVGWTGHDLAAVAEVDDEPDEDAVEHVEPALHDFRVPACLAALYPNDVVADWAARTFEPRALETIRALTSQPIASPRFGAAILMNGDALYKENISKMYEDAQKSEAPDEETEWEGKM
jgi:hypothetical protein